MKKILMLVLTVCTGVLWAADLEFVLDPGKNKSLPVTAPADPAKQLQMSVSARIDAPRAGGGMLDALVMSLNGKRITADNLSVGESNQIIFRGKARPLFPGKSRMMVIYAPSFETTAKEARITGENIFTRKFDLGTLMTPGQKGKLVFVNPWSPQQAKRLKNDLKLFVVVKIEEVSAAPAETKVETPKKKK